jgi:hypothetical protein
MTHSQAVVEKVVLGLQGQKGIEAAAVEGRIGGEHREYADTVRVLCIVIRARLDLEEAGPLVLGRVCAGGVWLYADVGGEIGVESDAVVERVKEDGDVVLCSVDRPSAWDQRRRSQWTTGWGLTVEERGEVAA